MSAARATFLGTQYVRLRRWIRAAAIAHAPRLWIRCATPDERELGAWGEEIAARHLVRSGWQLLGRRVETAAAEVDLVARDGGRLVCVEVKTARALTVPRPRGAAHDTSGTAAVARLRWRPGARCDVHQLARLARAARLLATWSRPAPCRPGRDSGPPRIDLIEVWLLPGARGWKLVHHRGLRRPLD